MEGFESIDLKHFNKIFFYLFLKHLNILWYYYGMTTMETYNSVGKLLLSKSSVYLQCSNVVLS